VITSFEVRLSAGQTVKGKWNNQEYTVERMLGEGANGQVYLVRRGRALFALKMGLDALDLQSEVNVLSSLSDSSGSFRHYLADVDDCVIKGRKYSFYVMKYVRGSRLREYLAERGYDWFGLTAYRLLGKLSELHGRGWVFGDIKMENVLVSGYGEVELVDFGGVTPKGRSVKQFTEVYDRAYWGAGPRSADEAYDLFAFGIFCLQATGPNRDCFSSRLLPQNRSTDLLIAEAERDLRLRKFVPFLRKVWSGQHSSSQEAMQEWKSLLLALPKKHAAGAAKGSRKSFWLTTGFAASLLIFLSAVYGYLY
jgi:serine/threonine protein kinase